jgi:hypothetical protein
LQIAAISQSNRQQKSSFSGEILRTEQKSQDHEFVGNRTEIFCCEKDCFMVRCHGWRGPRASTSSWCGLDTAWGRD